MTTHPEWLPTDPPRVAPPLMTADEAAAYLRLTECGRDIADALKSLEYLVLHGRIRPCRVGRFNRYARAELDRFIHDQTEQYRAKPERSAPDLQESSDRPASPANGTGVP